MVSLSAALMLVCYTFLAAGVQAAHAAEQGSDVMASFKDALVDISGQGSDGSGRTLLESTHFLAWDRWTGFSPLWRYVLPGLSWVGPEYCDELHLVTVLLGIWLYPEGDWPRRGHWSLL